MALGFIGAADAATIWIDFSTNKEPVSYAPNEPMIFTIALLLDGKPLPDKILKWTVSGDDQKTTNGEAKTSLVAPLQIRSAISKPGFVHIHVDAFNQDGSPLADATGKPISGDGGAGAAPEKIEEYTEPADFDAFWATQRKALDAVPLKFSMNKASSTNPKFELYDVKIDCAGGRPVSGYFTIPVGAAPHSLIGKVSFHGYGVDSATPGYEDGKMILDINAHGLENGKDAAYYQGLSNGELKGYAFDKVSNQNPETCYFHGMILRVMRALEFVEARPEWDGKNLEASGGSQGGFQAILAAGLDHHVTSCAAWKPWCCDLGGNVKLGRMAGWRPEYTDALRYYDPVYHAKRIKANNVFIFSGLGDYTCPSSGLSVLYNNISVSKEIRYVQGTTHFWGPPNAHEQTLHAP